MRNAKIEQTLKNAINNSPSLAFEELASMPYVTMQEHDYITRQEEPKNKVHFKNYATALSFCLLLVVSISWWYTWYRASDSIITLDVNPSIQIRTNQMDRIISVTALNDDAKAILSDGKYKGKELDEIIKVLMDSLIEQQYLNQNKRTILLSVMNKNSKKADVIMNNAAKTIEDTLSAQNISPTIMKQIIDKKDNSAKLAKQYHISIGKLKLIRQMIALNDKFTIDMLANMTIQQLFDLANENSMDLSKYLSISDKTTNPSNQITKAPGENNVGEDTEDTEDDSDVKENDKNEQDDAKELEDRRGNDHELKDDQKSEDRFEEENDEEDRSNEGQDESSKREDRKYHNNRESDSTKASEEEDQYTENQNTEEQDGIEDINSEEEDIAQGDEEDSYQSGDSEDGIEDNDSNLQDLEDATDMEDYNTQSSEEERSVYEESNFDYGADR